MTPVLAVVASRPWLTPGRASGPARPAAAGLPAAAAGKCQTLPSFRVTDTKRRKGLTFPTNVGTAARDVASAAEKHECNPARPQCLLWTRYPRVLQDPWSWRTLG
eukprot:NODE_5291_length_719_cov_3.207463_g4448_i0.p1 GENE.NODE_5291_length_719_cov_3.207463_g4448_i0~~NODE_5291_length_719_cov_3.207463_g4448_i0.p1  ORF type:complete len:105 (-),score=2.51 NODE_5291_length_719_cov_3.207463_g4448_i0:247-561(-)